MIIIIVAYDVILNSFINAIKLLLKPRCRNLLRGVHSALQLQINTADDEGFLWISRARNALLLGDYSALPMRDLVIIQRINCTSNSLPFSHTT